MSLFITLCPGMPSEVCCSSIFCDGFATSLFFAIDFEPFKLQNFLPAYKLLAAWPVGELN